MTTITNKVTLETFRPLIEFAQQSLMAGTLQKNVIKHFTNRGLSYDAGKNIVDIAMVTVEKFTHYKIK